MSLGADLDEIDPCRRHECICFLFHFLTQKAQHLSNFMAKLCGLDICEYDIPARNTEQHEDCAWLASGSSRTDFPLSVVAWEIPSSSQVSARCRFRRSHRVQKDWIFPQRIEDC